MTDEQEIMTSTETAPAAQPIDYDPTVEEFRLEVRSWLSQNAPVGLPPIRVGQDPEPEHRDALKAWADAMFEAGYMCVSWPQEYGGRGLSGVEVAVMSEEFERAGVPRLTRGMGETLAGPAIIAHGTEEQKRRFLPPIISGEHEYCQGFSEPGAGSDLAGLRTRGVVDGDELVMDGQKVWTSNFSTANMIFILCRTDPDAPKHRGISYVLTPLKLDDGQRNGVEFRPIIRIDGTGHFAETFISGARAPLDHVIGGLNNGWRVAMTTLGSERGGSAATQHIALTKQFWNLVDEVRKRGLAEDVRVREELAWAYSQVEMMRYSGLELLADLAQGGTGDGLANGSTSKVRWSEYLRRFAEIAMDYLGPDALVVEPDYGLSPWQEDFFMTRSHTIWGGTAEVQRNIIAERVLGLPKDPSPTAKGRTA